MHLGKTAEDVAIITSCVKGMKARAVRNAFTDRLAARRGGPARGRRPGASARTATRAGGRPASSAWPRGSACAATSSFKESFCITDALLAAAVHGDTENGLFYTGQSLVRIGERTVEELPTAAELLAGLEEQLAADEKPIRAAAVQEAAA